jgi:hypothetical protein
MSRLATWVSLSIAGFAYWGFAHGFAPEQIDHAAAPIWFGGVALLTHWITNIGGTP